jgi:anti-sigma regulatory factor (Ser/Thr protein kinase)
LLDRIYRIWSGECDLINSNGRVTCGDMTQISLTSDPAGTGDPGTSPAQAVSVPRLRASWLAAPRHVGSWHGSDAREVRATSVVLLPWTPESVAIARQRLRADLSAAGVVGQAAGDAALVISELLSNSIKHAWPLPGEQVRATWMVDCGSVQLTVSDGGGPTRPRQDYPPISALGGRGLGIVERLADNWGVRADAEGQTVWAVLPAHSVADREVPVGQ